LNPVTNIPACKFHHTAHVHDLNQNLCWEVVRNKGEKFLAFFILCEDIKIYKKFILKKYFGNSHKGGGEFGEYL
jgi:hypothetical protein